MVMKKELKDFSLQMKSLELENANDYGFSKEEELGFIDDINKFWNDDTFENREIVLEDLKADEGILYLKMVEWNDILMQYDLNFDPWEYSLEDFFRDNFGLESDIDNSDLKLFSIEDINKMMYGADYDLNIVGKY
jgi:hypothetical protein